MWQISAWLAGGIGVVWNLQLRDEFLPQYICNCVEKVLIKIGPFYTDIANDFVHLCTLVNFLQQLRVFLACWARMKVAVWLAQTWLELSTQDEFYPRLKLSPCNCKLLKDLFTKMGWVSSPPYWAEIFDLDWSPPCTDMISSLPYAVCCNLG